MVVVDDLSDLATVLDQPPPQRVKRAFVRKVERQVVELHRPGAGHAGGLRERLTRPSTRRRRWCSPGRARRSSGAWDRPSRSTRVACRAHRGRSARSRPCRASPCARWLMPRQRGPSGSLIAPGYARLRRMQSGPSERGFEDRRVPRLHETGAGIVSDVGVRLPRGGRPRRCRRRDTDSRTGARAGPTGASTLRPHPPGRSASPRARPTCSSSRRGRRLEVEADGVRQDHRVGQPVRDAGTPSESCASPWWTPIDAFCRQRPPSTAASDHSRTGVAIVRVVDHLRQSRDDACRRRPARSPRPREYAAATTTHSTQ